MLPFLPASPAPGWVWHVLDNALAINPIRCVCPNPVSVFCLINFGFFALIGIDGSMYQKAGFMATLLSTGRHRTSNLLKNSLNKGGN